MTPFLQLLLILCVLIVTAKAGGWLATRLHQPAVLGELLAGLILGPTFLNVMGWPLFSNLTEPHLLSEMVFELAELGVVCLMFLAGLEVELQELLQSRRVSALAGIGGVLCPILFGGLLAYGAGYPPQTALFVGLAITSTSAGISAQTLLELGKLRTREGMTLLGAAVMDDMLVILLFSLYVAATVSGVTHGADGAIGILLLKAFLYLFVSSAVAFFLLPRLVKWIQHQSISEGVAALTLVAMMLFAWSAEFLGGLATITGAFIAGLGLGRSSLRAQIARQMHVFTYAFLVPIFFISIGLKTNLWALQPADLPFAVALVVVAGVAKLLGAGEGARWGGFSNVSALRVATGMLSRGEVSLIVTAAGVQSGLLPASFFSIITLMVLITTLITAPLLRWSFREPLVVRPAAEAQPANEG